MSTAQACLMGIRSLKTKKITVTHFKTFSIVNKNFGFGTQIRKSPFFDPKKQITALLKYNCKN